MKIVKHYLESERTLSIEDHNAVMDNKHLLESGALDRSAILTFERGLFFYNNLKRLFFSSLKNSFKRFQNGFFQFLKISFPKFLRMFYNIC